MTATTTISPDIWLVLCNLQRLLAPILLHLVLMRTWAGDRTFLLYYNLLIEERLRSSTLPSTRDCLCLQEKPLHETGKDAGTRDDLRKKGPDSHLLCREDVEDVLCVGRGWWDCLGGLCRVRRGPGPELGGILTFTG